MTPYEGDLCLIGTTDIPYEGRAEDVAVDEAERDYLLRAVNRYMRRPLDRGGIVHEYSGIRPLHDDDAAASASAVTRDYTFDIEGGEGRPPVLSVFGGKITTYRKLAEHAMGKLAPFLPRRDTSRDKPWTADAPLPGGDMPDADFDAYLRDLRGRHPWLPAPITHHYARLYGTRAEALLDGARGIPDLGRHFGAGLYEREADFLRRTEWARTPDDVLTRRTKHHLHLSPAEREAFADWWERAA